jgi:MFS family permease
VVGNQTAAGKEIIGAAPRAGFNSEQIKVLGLSGLGGAIELYEFIVFILLTPYISQAFFPASTPEWVRTLQTLAIFALGYLVRPLGGIFIAMLGDVVGRKRTFALTIFLMAVPTLLIGLLPTYGQIGVFAPILLLLCRLVQGLALGGEVPGAAVFVAEHVPTQRLGFSCSLVGAGLAVGIFLGAFIVGTLTAWLGPQSMAAYGWRVVFLIGGVFGLLAAYVRHYVRETPVFQMMQERRKVASRVPIGALLRDSKAQLVAGLAVSFMAAAVPPVLLLYPPIYMRTALRFDPVVVQNAQAVASIALAVGSVAGGWLTDALGAVRTYLLYAIAMVIVSYLLFMSIQTGPNYLSLWYALVGFFGGISALGYFFLVQGFPPEVRLTGVAIPYNISTALGGSLPIVVASLMPYDTLAPAHIMLLLAVCTVPGASFLWAKRKPIGFDA